MKFFSTAVAAGMLLLQLSCNQAANSKSEDMATSDVTLERVAEYDQLTYRADTIALPENPPKKQQAGGSVSQTVSEDWDKKIIKNAVLNLQVKDYKSFNQKLRSSVAGFGGYIASEEQHSSDYKIEEMVTIRIPVDQFDNAVMKLAEGADKIVEKRITSEDVTAGYFDTKARLESKRHIRQRYLELLKRANKMTDVIEVEKEINNIQQEIDAAAGRMNYITHASAYSSLELTFFQLIDGSDSPETKPSFLTQIKNAFKTGARWSGELLLGLIAIWPLWIFVLISWYAFKKLRLVKLKSTS